MFLLIILSLNSLIVSCSESKAPTSSHEAPTSVIDNDDATMANLNTDPASIKKEKVIMTVNTSSAPIKVTVQKEPTIEKITVKITTDTKTPVTVKPIVEKVNKEETVDPIKETPHVKQPRAGHENFHRLLQKYVKNGLVNYAGFKTDQEEFDAYLGYLAHNAPSTSDNSKAALAFWMNAYNAFTIKLIVDNLPVKSIRDLYDGKPWDEKWIEMGDKMYSLNSIEHDIIRPVFNDPRIHFAIVCAAQSCPPIDNEAFTASNVDMNLERLTKSFINNPKFNTITEDKVTITPIMDWYANDFGDVLSFVQKYATTSVGDKAKVKFTDYDWALNKQ